MKRFLSSLHRCSAQKSPARRAIRPRREVVVPWPPGQATDIAARIVAEKLQASLASRFVIDNRAGAAARSARTSSQDPRRLQRARRLQRPISIMRTCRRRRTTR